MGHEARSRKVYEERVVQESLTRLSSKLDLGTVPLTVEELQVLAKRARQWFRAYGSNSKRERIAKYKDHLAARYDKASVECVWRALEQINNSIGYEEK